MWQNLLSTAASQLGGLMTIAALPDEVLLLCFRLHVWCNSDTPQRLLRVCRRWHAIVTGASSLWGDIFLSYGLRDSTTLGYSLLGTGSPAVESKIFCPSIPSLAAAIERTKASKFELTISPNWVFNRAGNTEMNLLQPIWFSQRCRALRFVVGSTGSLLSISNDLSALERLEICDEIYRHLDRDAESINSLLDIVQRTSKRLWRLHAPEFSLLELTKYSSLLSRMEDLRLQVPWNTPVDDFVNIAKSTVTLALISASLAKSNQSQLHCPSPSLETLILKEVPWCLFSPETASKIKYMTISFVFQDESQPHFLEFPNMTHLTVADRWSAMAGIQAPKLHYLKLLHSIRSYSEYEYTDRVTLRPRILDMDMAIPELEGRQLIFELWKDVERLQIVYTGQDRSLWWPLASWLRGKEEQGPLCPKIESLLILSSESSSLRKERSERLLKEVAQVLEELGRLRVVKYGWYRWKRGIDPRESPIVWTTIMGE